MKVLIFGGTSEARQLSRLLTDAGADVTVCVASNYGYEEQNRVSGVKTKTGPLSREEKSALLGGSTVCVDATHPYATHITVSVREACREADVPYLRLLRPAGDTRDARCFPNAENAAAWLGERDGNILLTTGAKELDSFQNIAPERLYPRILPNHQSLDTCERLGIPHRNIIAMQGPFSTELNTALIRSHDIRYLVTKDGGTAGGFPEKAEAARQTGVDLILICRPEETGSDFETVYQRCIALLQSSGANTVRFVGSETEGEET